MDDKELYERQRMHGVVNELHRAVGKIDLLAERDASLQYEITRINNEQAETRKTLSKIANEQSAIANSVSQLNKFFWFIITLIISGVGAQIAMSLGS